jgi:hypothetical protein
MKVSIDLPDDVLKWAAHKAIDLKMTRKEFLERQLKVNYIKDNTGIDLEKGKSERIPFIEENSNLNND